MPLNLDTAMILAAGLGTRMRPITLTIPKPMVTVYGTPIIDHILERLEKANVSRTIVNVHYLADVLETHLKQRNDIEIQISDERKTLLDSGGGILNALPLIDREYFYLCNADTIWLDGASVALKRLKTAFNPETMGALLLLAPTPNTTGYDGRGDFHMAQNGTLTRRIGAQVSPFVYTGVAILSRKIFDGIDMRVFSLNKIFNTLIENNQLYGIRLEGLWMHIGTPEAIIEAEIAWKAYYQR